MDTIISVLGFIFGLGVIVKLSDIAVDLSVKFSKITGLMKMSIGMLIIAVMTSLPELSIALTSSISNASRLMFGNLIGANITDLLFVTGICAVMYGFKTKESKKGTEIMLITGSIMVYGLIFGFNITLGLISILLFGLMSKSLLTRKTKGGTNKWKNIAGALIVLLKLIFVILIILFAAELVTLTSIRLSDIFGITETLIGATIISISTTLPELSVTLSAGKKREFELGFGNILGSCFVNIAFILGLGIIIAPVYIGIIEIILAFALFITYFIIFIFLREGSIDRFGGMILLLMYVIFLLFMIFTG